MSKLVFAALVVAGCAGPGHVEFTGGRCVIDGRTATLEEVEARQAHTSERIVARQPLMVVVTILVVLLAGASHIEKLVLLLSTRGSGARGLGERLRAALDRYRDHPMRYFSIVAGTLFLLGAAGGAYVFLDAEKRANERALGLLQFCHVALRNRQADLALDEQRKNLASIESTAGNIRGLVDRLPPQHAEEAKQIVEQLRHALGEEGRQISAWAQKNDESSQKLRDETALVEHGLVTLEGALKGLGPALREISDEMKRAQQETSSSSKAAAAKLDALKSSLDALAARPQCPPCVCNAERSDGGARR